MPHRFALRPDRRLLVVVFSGEISSEEEIRALESSLQAGLLGGGPKVLVDRRAASMRAASEDVARILETLLRWEGELGRPRVAQVVSSDLDYGMMRMLELKSEGRIDHDFAVFRSLPEACAWLDVAPDEVEALCAVADDPAP